MPTERELYFNGINGATGEYGLAPMTGEQLATHILGMEGLRPDDFEALVERHDQDRLKQTGGTIGVKEGIDPTNLAQAGWGIIFEAGDPLAQQIQEALGSLLDLRQSQTGHFKVYERGDGYRPGKTASQFLERHGVRLSDPANPEKVPYYLLIVGNPDDVPYHFQYQLDVQYAVGRLDFGADLDAYANYARSVVGTETGQVVRAPEATFFGVANPDDPATNLSADHLVRPLYEQLQANHPEWHTDAVLRDEATKARLLRLMGGEETPAFLFTASHGMEFPPDDPKKRQVPHQGALLCQDWPGPDAGRGEIPQDYYLAGEDIPSAANLSSLIAFFFACYGAGTPLYDEFTKQAFRKDGTAITERPFVAALPGAMLSLPRGGALAVIGHVERAWGTSFLGPRQSEQITVFESAIERLLKGHPVGSALEYFDMRYAALSTELTVELERIERSGDAPSYDAYALAGMWTANNDARGYVIIGDPAVRLPVAPTASAGVLDKPDTLEITDQEWEQTPLSVKKYIQRHLHTQ
jgi:hypothetical protein